MKTLRIAPLSVGIHAMLFDERKNMLVPHLTSPNNPQNLVKHLADPSATPHQIFMFTKTNAPYPTWGYQPCVIAMSGRSLLSSHFSSNSLNWKLSQLKNQYAHLAAVVLALLKQPLGETCQRELETHQDYQIWKWLLGKETWFPVVCICQDYPILLTKLSQSLNEVEQQVKKGRGSGTHHP